MFASWKELLNFNIEEDISGYGVIDEYEGRFNADYHLRMFHEIPTHPDPAAILRAMVAPFGEINKAPEFAKFEEMLNAAAVELDTVKRHEMYLDIEQYLLEEALVIPIEPIAWSRSYRTQPWIHDLKPPKYPGSTFHNVWLDERAPKRELPLP